MILDERWLPVVGNDGYLVLDQGRVRQIATGALIGTKNGNYPGVGLRQNDGTTRTLAIHRLVMAAFTGVCPAGIHVNHKNGDAGDNRLANLEYVTPKENARHALRLRPKKRIFDRIMPVLVDEQSLADYRRAAEADKRTLSGWVRMVLSREAASKPTKSELGNST